MRQKGGRKQLCEAEEGKGTVKASEDVKCSKRPDVFTLSEYTCQLQSDLALSNIFCLSLPAATRCASNRCVTFIAGESCFLAVGTRPDTLILHVCKITPDSLGGSQQKQHLAPDSQAYTQCL